MGNIKNIPQLRFPEFEDLLNTTTISEISQGKLSNGVFNDPNKIGTGYYLINVKDMYTNLSIDKSSLTKLNINENEFKRNKVSFGDIFFTRSSLVKEGIAFSAVNLNNDEDITFDGHLIKLTPNQKIINPIYLAHLLKTDYIRKQLIARGKTGTMTTIGQEDIGSTKVIIPSLPEQKKIASFLTAVDDKIHQLTKKKSLLEQYKKGVMQKIFNQEIRFKDDDGKEFPEWEEKKVGDVYNFFNTNSFSRENLNYDNGKFFNIHYGDIHTKFRSHFDLTKENVPYINSGIHINNFNERRICREGDLIFADASEDYNDIGKCMEIINTDNREILSGLHTLHARPHHNKMYTGFGGYLMQSDKIKKQIKIIAQGIKVLSISSIRLKEIYIDVPIAKEQQKIANFLSTIDNKIDHVNTQLEKTKAFKKGLLQQMFV